MLRQISLILKREWWDLKTTIFSMGNIQVGLLPILFFSAAFGIYEPLAIGSGWIESPIMAFSYVVLIPIAVIAFISPNSIVGERIAKTLEPLLATPVRNAAILIGKAGMSVIFGWSLSLITMIIGLATINLFHLNGVLLLYPANMSLQIILGSLLFSIFISVLGINFSLYSATMLEAQNKLGAVLFVPLIFSGFILSPLIPKDWRFIITKITSLFGGANSIPVILWSLLIINCLLFVFVLIRFNRERMIFGEFYKK